MLICKTEKILFVYKAAGVEDYLVLPQNISKEVLALGIRKGETGFKTAVDKLLRGLEKSREAEKLFFKWYGPASNVKFEKRTFKIESDKIDS